jgi:hypothetical protein
MNDDFNVIGKFELSFMQSRSYVEAIGTWIKTAPTEFLLFLVKHRATKTYWENGGIAFLTSALDRSSQFQAPAALPSTNSPWYPLNMRLGGPQSRSERGD